MSLDKTWREYQEKIQRIPQVNSPAGIPLDVLYVPEEGIDEKYMEDIGLPGQYPFVRGVYPGMYRNRLWTMRQYAGFGTPEDSNKRYKYLLEQGQTGLSVAFDLPTQMGYDSDNEFVEDEVGRVGVAIDTLADFEVMFEGIPLDKISTSFTINATAPIILAMYIVMGEKQGVPQDKLTGTLQNDILKEYYARNTYIYPPDPSLRLSTDIVEYCSKYIPRFNPISVCGYHVREAGCDAVQEIAFAVLAGEKYIDEAIKRGIDIDDFVGQISFNISSGMDLFEEVCKHRAFRKVWAKLIKEKYNPKKESSCRMRFFSGGSGIRMASQEPLNNVIRSTIETLVVLLGGAQACHVMAYDEAYAVPSESSATLALRVQQILAYESGIANTVDPLGGSYYVEQLTKNIEKEAWDLIHDIQNSGGITEAILSGKIEKEVFQEAYKNEKDIESGDKVIVGVNKFASTEKTEFQIQDIDGKIIEKKIEDLKSLKKTRNKKEVEEKLENLIIAAKKENENLMPYILDAVRSYCSVGEITDALKKVFGTHQRKNIF